MRAALEIVSPGSVARLGQLLQRVRVEPIRGRTRDADGTALRVTVDPRALSDLVQDSASDPVILRELDASVRAALAGDDVPLLRLAGRRTPGATRRPSADYFSRGAYLAVACLDYPQLFDRDASPAQRRAQLRRRLPPNAFRAVHRRRVDERQRLHAALRRVPRLAASRVRAPPRFRRAACPRRVPILIIGGDLDSLTPLADAPPFGPELGENVRDRHGAQHGPRHLAGRSTTSSRACAARGPSSARSCAGALDDALRRGDPARCTPPHGYPLTLADAAPARLVSGPDPGEGARRAATVAAEAFADAIARRLYSSGNRGPGLRGGRFTVDRGRRRHVPADRRPVRHRRDRQRLGTWDPRDRRGRRPLAARGVTRVSGGRRRTPSRTSAIGDSVLSCPPRSSGHGRLPRHRLPARGARVRRPPAARRRRPPHPRGRPARRQLAQPPAAALRRAARPRGGRRDVFNPSNVLGAALLVAIVVVRQGPARARRRPRRAEHAARRARRGDRLVPERDHRRADAMAASSAWRRASRSRRCCRSAIRRGRATRSAARRTSGSTRANRKPFDDVVSER